MMLNVEIDGNVFQVTVPDQVMSEGHDFFTKMDKDMDNGWQMGREWIESLSAYNRCQIAANKLLTALENENENLAFLMAGYILTRLPSTKTVRIDVNGEILNTEIINDDTN